MKTGPDPLPCTSQGRKDDTRYREEQPDRGMLAEPLEGRPALFSDLPPLVGLTSCDLEFPTESLDLVLRSTPCRPVPVARVHEDVWACVASS